MNVRCEHCGLDIEAPPDSVGKALRCPACGKTFICRLPRAIVVGDQADQEPDDELILLDEVIEAEEGPLDTAKDEPVETVGEDGESPLEAVAEASVISADEALAKMGAAAPKRIVKENPHQWYIMVAGVAAVALTYQELVARAAREEIKPRSKIYYAPAGLTVPAQDIPGLFPEQYEKRKKKGKVKVSPRRPSARASSKVADIAEALGHLGDKK